MTDIIYTLVGSLCIFASAYWLGVLAGRKIEREEQTEAAKNRRCQSGRQPRTPREAEETQNDS